MYINLRIFCVDPKETSLVFFQNLSRDFHRRMVALAASGFNKKRALLDKALEDPRVGQRLLVLTLPDVLVDLVRFQQCGDSPEWSTWEKLRELLWCFVQSVKYLLARGTSGLPFGKKCKQKTVYCCDGHCALGAHQPLGDGHTSARSGEPKRDPISQFPNHRNPTGCHLRGSQRKTIHFHVLDASSNSSSAHFHIFGAEQVVLAVAAAMGTMKRNTQGGNLLGEWQDVL